MSGGAFVYYFRDSGCLDFSLLFQ